MGEAMPVRASDDQDGRCHDQGSASIWVLTFTALVLLAGVLSMTLAAVGSARARASAAADLAALAGAGHLADGSGCQWAREAALRNFANLLDCRAGPSDITVSVSVPLRLALPRLPASASIRSTARAGTTPDAVSRE
jgi:secretion/DNA translocation related TadE-like protein